MLPVQENYLVEKENDYESAQEPWFVFLNAFRRQQFENEEAGIKKAWFIFCDKIMPEVNKNWKSKMAWSNSLMSSVCSMSDEAFALTVCDTKLYDWITKIEKQARTNKHFITNGSRAAGTQEEDETNEELEKQSSEQGEMLGKNSRKEYYKKFLLLQTRNNANIDIWNSWDEGFRNHISIKSVVEAPPVASNRVDSACGNAVFNNQETIKFDEW